ncbi:unnamed protein product [Ceratitis capitata]|uniref:(Mediterranean fruit fly) hypothetical protein n=1 Tax=Ceratitis capitata TaxID=7213 RepID=A0A811UQZ7_CERCA|nr:unnamed protein product [Ceratitis capitata]
MTFCAAYSPYAKRRNVKTQDALDHSSKDRTSARAIKAIMDYHYVDTSISSVRHPNKRELLSVVMPIIDTLL